MQIRELRSDELDFLGEMLYAALDWRGDGQLPPRELVLEHELVVIYHRGWGRPGDAGVVAEEDGKPVGAAWYRLFTQEDAGFGFVDEQTPELAIAVVPSKRGHGIGDELLQELIAKARDAGYQRLSLSVEPGNPARKLYERHGFSIVDEGAEAWTMVASL